MSIEKDIIIKASDLENGDSLFIPVKTKKEQMKRATILTNLAKDYVENVDNSISLSVMKTFQDGKLWIKIEKDKAPSELFIKTKDGIVKRTSIQTEN